MTPQENKGPAPLAGDGLLQTTEPGMPGVIAVAEDSTAPTAGQAQLFQAALGYARRGWHVFPCRPGGKEPLVRGGYQAATTDEATIYGWWDRWPDANIGVHPAPGGLVVLDVDAKKGGKGLESWKTLLARFGESLADTVMANTPSGGLHVYYQKPAAYIRNATEDKSPLGRDIGVRVNGLYVVAPPSRTPTGAYSWVTGKSPFDRDPAPVPGHLVALLAGGKSGTGGKSGEKREVSGGPTRHSLPITLSSPIHDGARNNTLFRLGCALRGEGKSYEEIEKALLETNAKWCVPPLEEDAVRQIAARAAKYEPGEPQTTPRVEVVSGDDRDYHNAKFLAEAGFGRRARWATHRNAWMLWLGMLWRETLEGGAARVATEMLLQRYATLRATATDEETKRDLKRRERAAAECQRIRGALTYLKCWPGIMTLPGEWDPDPWFINTPSGIYSIRNRELFPHDPDAMMTKLANVEISPGAVGKAWEAHINRFLPDPDIRRQVQRDLGRALVGEPLEESLPIWYGEGANGKTTTARVLMRVLGDYAGRAAPNLLVASKQERHPAELADLAGLRLVFSAEVDQGRHLSEALVKDLTGGDPKKARHLWGNFFTFPQTFSIVLITNHKPIVAGNDYGIWRRLRLIPWEYRIPENERRRQPEVVTELCTESGAIFNWLLAGLDDYLANNSWVAEGVRAASEVYRADMDGLGEFLKDRCSVGPNLTIPKAELYRAYVAWCEENNERPLSARGLTLRLRERKIGEARDKTARYYTGVTLMTLG